MKTIRFTLAFLFAGTAASLSAQSYCDSLSLTATTVNTQVQSIDFDFHNSGSYMMSYPVLNLVLASNPYMAGGSVVNTFLNQSSVNGGNTTLYVMCSNFTPASQVPLNTLFTGTLTLLDPNDSSTFCTYAVSFTYGTMVTSGIGNSVELTGISLFPNPAAGMTTVQVPQSLLTQQPLLQITDFTGRIVAVVRIREEHTAIMLENFAAGLYSCTLKTANENLFTWKLAVNR